MEEMNKTKLRLNIIDIKFRIFCIKMRVYFHLFCKKCIDLYAKFVKYIFLGVSNE